jgi:hypothetical protein
MTPGRCAEGMRAATALGSFGLTSRSVRKTPSVRSELSKWLTIVGQHAQLFGLSQRAIIRCHLRIVGLLLGRPGATLSDGTALCCQSATMFCSM